MVNAVSITSNVNYVWSGTITCLEAEENFRIVFILNAEIRSSLSLGEQLYWSKKLQIFFHFSYYTFVAHGQHFCNYTVVCYSKCNQQSTSAKLWSLYCNFVSIIVLIVFCCCSFSLKTKHPARIGRNWVKCSFLPGLCSLCWSNHRLIFYWLH